MIVDTFPFYNELDILELRLRTLDTVVDRFVLCESPFTFRGGTKPLYFQENAERFARWRDRITVLTYPGPPIDDPWEFETRQRDYLMRGLAGTCADDDLVLLSDADEIPFPENIARAPQPGGIVLHWMSIFRGYLNRADANGEPVIPGTRTMFYRDIPALFEGRLGRIRLEPHPLIENVYGGWHFTSLGGVDVMRAKMDTYSHTEYRTPYYTDRYRLAAQYDSNGGSSSAVEIARDKLPPVLAEPYWEKYFWTSRPPITYAEGLGLEHAHGIFGYLPATARRIAVLTLEPAAWQSAAGERFPDRFRGAFDSLAACGTAADPHDWLIVDRLERFPAGTLAALARAGFHAIVFATNARSVRVLDRVLLGDPFPFGYANGRADIERIVRESGFRVVERAIIANQHVQWAKVPPGSEKIYSGTIPPFTFSELSEAELHDFQTDAFVFTLEPAVT
jgi:hypothetical protein